MRKRILLNILGVAIILALAAVLVNHEYNRVSACNGITPVHLTPEWHGVKAKNTFTRQVRYILTPCYPVWWQPID